MSVLTRNNVKVTGEGQPMVFAHSYAGDQSMWKDIAPTFENSYKVVLFDHVGFGKSDLSAFSRTKYQSLEQYAEDFLEIYSILNLRDSIFIGHSVSGMIGVLAAIRDPKRFAKLILIGSSPRYINDEKYVGGFSRKDIDAFLTSIDNDYSAWAKSVAPVFMGNSHRPALTDELLKSLARINPTVARHFAKITFLSDYRDDLAKLQTPSLVLQATKDSISPVKVGEYVSSHLKESELVQLRAEGHFPHLAQPEETIAAIKKYLAK